MKNNDTVIAVPYVSSLMPTPMDRVAQQRQAIRREAEIARPVVCRDDERDDNQRNMSGLTAALRAGLCEAIKQVAEKAVPKEYISMTEAATVTGFTADYLRDLAQAAGITKFGRNAMDREEFFRYWRYRAIVEQRPKSARESAKERMQKINREWKRPG